jgi:hypothetical protein
MTVSRRGLPARLRTGVQDSVSDDTKGEGKQSVALRMPGVGLNSATDRKASPERSALKPYWGKPAVRNFREGDGNNGIIRSPSSAFTLLDREPGDLQYALVAGSRPVREGHKPNGGHERAGEVGLCRTTYEPAEQRRATFCGGRGGKGTDQGEHRSIAHVPDPERETHVPGIARCAASSKGKKAGTVHRFAPPPERRVTARQLLRASASSVAGNRWRHVAGV